MSVNHTHTFLDTQTNVNDVYRAITCSECGAETIDSIYNTNVDGNVITELNYPLTGQINVPTTINGNNINGIGNFVYANQGITGIIFPNTVTTIGASAFENCTGLTSISLASVQSIGASAFENCTGLTSVSLGGVSQLGEKVFKNCVNISKITSVGSLVGIGNNAFENCSAMTYISTLSSVQTIGSNAFADCDQLKSITLSSSAQSIGSGAFENCTSLTSAALGKTQQIGDNAFRYCSALASVTSTASVQSIGSNAFADCDQLKSITLSSSAQSIGSGAFENCTSLTSAALGKTQQIGDNAFRYCSALASVTSTASVQSIGSNAFEQCFALKKISLNGVQHIGSGAFKNCSNLQTIESLYIVQDIGDYAFLGCIALAEVTLPASLTSIAEGAFRACSGLETVHCISSPAIGTGAFADCLNLSEVYFEDEAAPAVQSGAFLNDSFTVYVPYCSRDAYVAVFAGYDAVVNSAKVTLTLMDGNTVLKTQEVYYKSTISLPELEKEDHLFLGWVSDPSGAGTDLGFSIYWTSYEDQTFYAHWLIISKDYYMQKIKSVADYYVLDAYESLYSTGFSVAELAEYYSEQDALLAGAALYNAMLPYADLQNYDRPEVIVSGNVGSSVQDEMQIIEENLHSFDRIVVTGTSACTFLAARGHSTGLGYVEESLIPYAQELMQMADEIGIDLILPEYVVTLAADQTAVAGIRPADNIPANEFPAMVPLPWYQDQVGLPGTLRVYGYPLLCPDDMLNESILGTVGENIRQFILHNEALGRSGARLAFLGDWQSQGTPEKYFYYSGDWRLPFGYPLWENLCGSSIGNVQTLADVEFQPGDVVAVRVEFILPAQSSKLYQQQFEKYINAVFGTVKYLTERGCKVILLANNPVEGGNLDDLRNGLQDKNFNDPSFLKQCSQYFGCDVGYVPIDDLQDFAASSAQVIWTDNLAIYEM